MSPPSRAHCRTVLLLILNPLAIRRIFDPCRVSVRIASCFCTVTEAAAVPLLKELYGTQ
jgi:hypothetical protein